MAEKGQRDPRTYAIIGAALGVHKKLGCGFTEPVYQEALEIEVEAREVPRESQKHLPVDYKGVRRKKDFVADFLLLRRSGGRAQGPPRPRRKGRIATPQLPEGQWPGGRPIDKLRHGTTGGPQNGALRSRAAGTPLVSNL